MKRLRPLYKVHGGKFYLSPWIISNFPDKYEDMTYVETYGGAASVLQNKNRSRVEVYNELNPAVVNLMWCMASGPAEFIKAVRTIPYSEESFNSAKTVISAGIGDTMTLAIAELVVRRMSRGGLGKEFGWSARERGGKPGDVNAWETFKGQLEALRDRWAGVIIRSEKATDLIEKYDAKGVLFYCDPPYLPSTRTAKKAYDEFEMTEEQHIELANVLTQAAAKVVLSGYDSELYQHLYAGWRCIRKKVKNNSGQGKKKQDRVECIWLNWN